MTYQDYFNASHPAVKSLLENGFEGAAKALEILFNESMKIERSNALNAAPYQRTEGRKGYANGFKPKTVLTNQGKMELEIPQVRGDVSFYPTSLEKGLRTEQALNLAIAEMYLQGVSTRKVSKILEKLCGEGISSDKVSRITKTLDEELKKWRDRPLGLIKYMFIDARYENVRVDGLVRSCALLVAIGVREDGTRSILGVSVSLSESEIHWREFLKSLQSRGMHGLKLITSDDHSGLKAALKSVFNGVPWQRCQYHLQQNAGHYVSKTEKRKEVGFAIRSIFNAPDLEEAERLLVKYIDHYEKKMPCLSKWMDENLREGFSVFSFEESLRKKLRTSNIVERQNKEFKRRSRVVEIFPNEASLLRLASAYAKERSESWEAGRVYLKEETIFKE